MSRFTNKKRALLTAGITSLVLVAVAIAFYTTTGSGSGEGTTDSAYALNLSIEGDVPAGLVPGAAIDLVDEKVTNPNDGSAKVTTVKATSIVVGTDSDACDDDWFSIDDVPVNTVLAPSGETGDSTTFAATIEMTDEATNQDACKNQPIAITWASDDVDPDLP